MTAAIQGWGSLLGYSQDGVNFTNFAEVEDISGPQVSVTVIDCSHLQSPLEWKEKIPGFQDAGEITFKLNFLKAEYSSMLSFVQSGSILTWKITSPALSAWTFKGFITKLAPAIPLDGKMVNDMTVAVTGKPTFVQ